METLAYRDILQTKNAKRKPVLNSRFCHRITITFQEWQENYQKWHIFKFVILHSKPWLMADSFHVYSAFHSSINIEQECKKRTRKPMPERAPKNSQNYQKLSKLKSQLPARVHLNQTLHRAPETPRSLFQSISTPETL